MKVGHLFERFFMRLSRKRRVDGMWIGVIGDKSDTGLITQVEEALKLIQQYDPVRYRRILRDVERIWILTLPGARGQFNFDFKRCSLDYRFVKSAPIEKIASTIVHEATHGHPCLRKFGYPESLRYRIETICMKQQLIFAQKIPSADEVRGEVGRNLTRSPDFWSDQAFAERGPGDTREAFKDLGVPDWMASFLLWIIRKIENFRRKKVNSRKS